ncbi:MAG: 4-(cytidine 5'-diphospho)-2-C-methyl-D-erythritol kinase, partial [Vitreimonas sp.]
QLGGAFAAAGAPHWAGDEDAVAAMRVLGNDLEAPAIALMPQVGEIVADLRASPTVRHAALSGSGATVFALARDWEAAEALAELLRQRRPECWVMEAMLGA